MTPIRIAALGGSDLAAVEAVSLAAFDPTYGEAWSKAQCLSVLTLPGYRLTGARVLREGETALLAGFTIDRNVADESELLLLAVHPDYRRQRIAARLLDNWTGMARARGINRAYLEMREDNPARALYTRHGFRQIAIRRDYYRGKDGVMRHAITMERRL